MNYLLLFLHKWDHECDRRLKRLVDYIWSSLDLHLMGWVNQNPSEKPDLHEFADSNFAGCLATQRSTTGCFLTIAGVITRFPLNAISKRQTSVGVSTPEVEWVAAHHALTYELLPAQEICAYVLREDYVSHFHEDNTAFIRVMKTGRNPAMRHVGRVHGVDLASMHEKFQPAPTGSINIFYEQSALMAADIFTKGYTNVPKWSAVMALINVYDLAYRTRIRLKYIT